MMNNEFKNVVRLNGGGVEEGYRGVLQSMYELEEIERKQHALFKGVVEAIQMFLDNLNGLTNGKS